MELVDIGGFKIGVLPLNSTLFCCDDNDHEKLWLGHRCLKSAAEILRDYHADLNVALIHHPLDWLYGEELDKIKATLGSTVDVVLRGHLHRIDVESIFGISGGILHLAAGAAYQTRNYPNRALYATVNKGRVTVFPIRYEDSPREIWTFDTSLFPDQKDYCGKFDFSIGQAASQDFLLFSDSKANYGDSEPN